MLRDEATMAVRAYILKLVGFHVHFRDITCAVTSVFFPINMSGKRPKAIR